MTNVTPIRPTIGLSRIEQLRAFVAWEKEQNPDKVHIAEWALSELEKKQVPVDYNDAVQIINELKAYPWELRDLANSLLEELLATQAREKVLLDYVTRVSIGEAWSAPLSIQKEATRLLAQSTDDTALKRLLAAERERCAKEAERQLEDEPYGHAKFRCANIAAEIRALGDQP